MIRIKEIQDKLLHLVGWEQSYSEKNEINPALTISESGLIYQNAHPLVTLQNIKSIMPEDFTESYPKWNKLIKYSAGQKVRHNGVIYIANEDNQNSAPYLDDFNEDFNEDFGGAWRPYNYYSDYLEKLTRNGISTAVQTFLQMKGLQQETKSLLERRTFFDGAGRLSATVQNRHKLVGFEIIPVRSMGVTAKIERIGLQMRGGTGKITLYLFHSSQIAPVKTFEVEYTKTNGGFQWFEVKDAYLPYISEGNNAGGAWFICYNQDDLPQGMEAINVSKDWSREPCGTCNIGSVERWRELTKYLQISPFNYPALETFAQFPELWDIADTNYTNTQNYGLNIEVSVGCDLTDFIIEQRHLFATVIQRQVAAIALRTMALNPEVRVNRNQSNVSRMDILYELDGNTSGTRPNGLGYELKKAYEALSLNTSGIDRICLSCNNKGVKYRTV